MENEPSPLMKPDIQLSNKVESLRSIFLAFNQVEWSPKKLR